MKISARNQLKGTVVGVTKGATTSHVRVDIGGGQMVTSAQPVTVQVSRSPEPSVALLVRLAD